MLRRSALLGLAAGLPLLAQSEAPAKPLRVLFIGNSYTIFNNLPYLVESIAASQAEGPRIQTGVSVSGGKTLKWHWDNGHALDTIRQGGWDFVVLQEQSVLGRNAPPGAAPEINDPGLYFEYGRKFHAEITKIGAKTVLYATWAREGYPEQQRRLDDAFTRLARETGAGIVPAGLAWTVARIEAPHIKLHMPDRSHPTQAGSYLNALLFYHCLTGRAAANPLSLITGPRRWDDPQTVTLVNLTTSDAVALSQFARRVVAQEPLAPVPVSAADPQRQR